MLTLFREEAAKRREENELRLAALADCQYEIELDGNYHEIKTNFDKIKGRVHCYILRSSSNSTLPSFKSLRIQLEGIMTTIGDNGLSNKYHQEHQFLPLEAATDSPSLSSLCFHFIKSSKATLPQFRSSGKTHHSFPFEIFLTGQNLPATFKNDFIKIEYVLVVYSCNYGDLEFITAQKVLTSKGCLNLSKNPSLFKPWIVSRRQKKKSKSIFYKRQNALKAHLMLQKRGFLPGENLQFEMDIENPMCEGVQKLYFTFLQKIYFSCRDREEIKSTILAQQEFNCNVSDGEIHWNGTILIPEYLMPSFTKNTCLGIIYLVQFAVELIGKPVGLKGETLIVIGTMRDDHCRHRSITGPSTSQSDLDDDLDTISIQTLPPSYSNLTSRQPSLETLPPAYEEIMEMDQEYEGLGHIFNETNLDS